MDGGGDINKDDLIIDEEDRQRLAGMTEFARENILFERAEARREEIQRQQLIAASNAAATTDDAAKKTETKAAARRSGREVREETAKKSAIEELKAARQRKSKGGKAHRGARAAAETYDDDDNDEEEEAGEGSGLEEGEDDDDDLDGGGLGSTRWAPRDLTEEDEEAAEEADFVDLKSIQVRRHKLEEWISKPHFEETMPGCMVRVAAGDRRAADGSVVLDNSGRPERRYILVQVVGVEELPPGTHKYLEGSSGWKSPYPFGPEGVKTSKWLKVLRGNSQRIWPLAQVSNSSINEDDYASWHRACEGTRRQITRGDVAAVKERLERADTYVFTAEDVAKMLEEKRQRGQGVKNVAMERARLERDRDAAVETGDEVRLAQLQFEIESLGVAAAAAVASRQGGAISMAILNQKNADLNFKTAFNAGKEGAGGAGAATGTLDPFSRRATRTRNYWNTQRQRHDKDGGSGGEEDDDDEKNRGGDEEEAAVVQVKVQEEEAVTLVDLSELDLSLLDVAPRVAPIARKLLLSGVGVNGGSVSSSSTTAHLRSVSLAEYRQRGGGRY